MDMFGVTVFRTSHGTVKYEVKLDAVEIPLFANVRVPVLVMFRAFPLLSLHWVTEDPERVIVVESAASNQRAHPGIDVGLNPAYDD